MLGTQLTGRGYVTKRIRNAKFEVLTAFFLRTKVLWHTTLCHWLSGAWHFKQTFHLHYQGLRGHLTLDNEGTTLLLSARNHTPSDTASHPRICQSQEGATVISVVYGYLVYYIISRFKTSLS
jgi:hypothetical protein